MTEKYLKIDPSGEISWIQIDRVPYSFDPSILGPSGDQIRAAIGCSSYEIVRTVLRGISIVVDESGKIKNPPQRHNHLASQLYGGWLMGLDNIAGPAIVFAERLTEPYGEMDLFPLSPVNLARLSLCLGVPIPEEVSGDV